MNQGEKFNVNVTTVPGKTLQASLAPGSTIQDALELLNINFSGSTITVNGAYAELDSQVEPNDSIMVAKERIKGA